jgi:sulfite reductase (NADPH) flavoprotein alpha-component
LSLEGSGLNYEPGDSLGVIPTNDRASVDALLRALALEPDTMVDAGGEEATLEQALSRTYEITTLSRPVLEKYAELCDADALRTLLRDDRADELWSYMRGRQVLDIVEQFPVKGVSAAEFTGILRKLPPRLYSIASSHKANPDEVHLTVAAVRYESHGRKRKGVASCFLAERLAEGDSLPVYVEVNRNFKLPVHSGVPIIMVGPGTGVAPFRAFVQERQATGARGGNWLFFGDRHFTTDFLYQREWQQYLKDGILTRMDVAFSRDQPHRIHVQQRMREKARDLYAWLQDGAHFYVCGDGERMAHDVHEALVEIVADQGRLSRERAQEYVHQMQREKRYQRDVY